MRTGFIAVRVVIALVASSAASRADTKDDVEAQFQAARARLRGGADTFSLEKAAAGFEAACKRGHQVACTSLALQLQDGRGVRRDLKRAILLYEKACDAGAGIGCMNRGFMLQGGVGDDADPARAAELFTRASKAFQRSCDAGDLQWCTNLGILYEGLVGGKPDFERAAAVYRKACDRQLGDWCVNLALLQLYDHLGPPDVTAAMGLLEKVCAAKLPLGCGALGKMLVLPRVGGKKDLPRGLALLDGACTDGEVQSCAVLGAVYGMGELVPRDMARADAMQSRACLLGASTACHLMALEAAEAGRRADAVPWLERGCNIGEGGSCALLGAMFVAGEGVKADLARALALFHDACQLGDLGSCVELLQRGRPVPLSAERRRQFMHEACAKGVAEACGKPRAR